MRAYIMQPLIGALSLLLICSATFDVEAAAGQGDTRRLSIEEFVTLVTANDTVFDEILIDELKLRYRRELVLPAKEIILSVKAQYDLFLGQGREEPDMKLSLSRLFPFRGTELSLTYERTPSISSESTPSSLQFLISQPIAQNAFGRSTKIKDKIAGIEIDVIRYQIIEAYEDYLATLLATYYSWYSTYENLMIGRASYKENLKLLDDINKRRKQNIALPIDVNKVKLLVIGKRERVIALEVAYENLTNLIQRALHHDSGTPLIPSEPVAYKAMDVDFERDYANFQVESRTYGILKLLEEKSSLAVAKSADDLLPSTNLLLGYKVAGEDWRIDNNDRMVFVGLSVEWPFLDKVDRAEHEISRIEERKTKLSSQNIYLQILADLKNLHIGLERERRLLKIADEKIELAEDILLEEAENYSFGKVTLNDYIDAVNRLDENRFNKISHIVQFNKLMVEWQRLTDILVDRRVLRDVGR
jgi:outer membrane protein TolC